LSTDLDTMTAMEMRRRVSRKDVSPVELTERALAKAERTQATLNAFFLIMPEAALAASVDAPAVERAKAAGGILIGKTTTSEFGCKPVGDSPLTGITRHPWNLSKTPGGSSAGAAASVAAGITPFALGTDGGGSVRIPCCFTGLAGIKAQFGRVPVWPTSATPTLAHVGPLARNVGDAALLLTAIGGYDPRDPFSVSAAMPDLLGACRASVADLRIAFSPTLGTRVPIRTSQAS
jgi:aspartyl-tRNA(Asn)/glutamyl-tRNA(Gln) amidotransferase subunit A